MPTFGVQCLTRLVETSKNLSFLLLHEVHSEGLGLDPTALWIGPEHSCSHVLFCSCEVCIFIKMVYFSGTKRVETLSVLPTTLRFFLTEPFIETISSYLPVLTVQDWNCLVPINGLEARRFIFGT